MRGSRTRLFVVSFGVAVAVMLAWFVRDRLTFQIEARRVTLDVKTIKYHTLTGEWSVEVYNGSKRRLKAVYVEVTVPITEVKRVFRLAPRGVLGEMECPPFSLMECRGKFGDFLKDPRIHGLWRLKGVEFSRKWW